MFKYTITFFFPRPKKILLLHELFKKFKFCSERLGISCIFCIKHREIFFFSNDPTPTNNFFQMTTLFFLKKAYFLESYYYYNKIYVKFDIF